MIEVVNRKHFNGEGIYIGRPMKGIPGSPLGPYKVKPHGPYERGKSISLYRRWLWNEIKRGTGPAFEELRRLVESARRGDLRLICWCKQPGANVACHGDVIRDAIEWMLAQGADKHERAMTTSIVPDSSLQPVTSAKSEISYVRGDATRPQDGGGVRIIPHCVNDQGFWGKGFVVALSRRWAEPEREYRHWHRNGGLPSLPFELGQVQLVEVAPAIFIANLIGQVGIRRNREGLPPVRYEALRQGLGRIAEHAGRLNASVHMPRIGAGLAGGNWEMIARIIEDELCAHGISVTIYDPAKNAQ